MAVSTIMEGNKRLLSATSYKQLLPTLIDDRANTRPEAVWAIIPRSAASWDEGHYKITYRLFAKAINALASWLTQTLGAPRRPFESVAYFGSWDPRYAIFIVAAMKAGYKAVLPSGGGKTGMALFLTKVECDRVLVADRDMTIAKEFEAEPGISVHEIPSVWELLENDAAHVAFAKTFEEAKNDPVLVLHSSGSTGEPKPLVYTHDWLATWQVQHFEPPPTGYQSLENILIGATMLAFTPQAHASGFYSNLLSATKNNVTCIYPLPNSTLTVDNLFETLRHNPGVDFVLTLSFLLDQITLSPSHVSSLASHTRMVAFGGGPLGQRTGSILSKHVLLFSMYGSTEMGTINKILPIAKGQITGLANNPNPAWWNYVVPHPNAGIQMRPLSASDASDTTAFFECVVVRNADPDLEQPVFKMKPEVNEWPTRDVFAGHLAPEYGPGFRFYEYAYRLDDTVELLVEDDVALIGRKMLVPLRFEQALAGTELVREALVFGQRKPYAGLLVELADDGRLDDLSVVDEVMQMARASAHLLGVEIRRDCVILARAEKPLPRSPKGTVQRAAALRLYQDEIEEIYRASG